MLTGLLLVVVTTFSGCSDAAKSRVAVKGISAQAKKPFVPAEGFVPAFYLDRAAFLAADDSIVNYKDKLVLQVLPEKGAPNFRLAIFTIADSDKTLKEEVGKVADKARIQYPKPFANALNLSGKKLRIVDQRSREDEYQKLLKEVKKYPFIHYVIFVPEADGDHVRFKLTGVEKLPLDMANGFATTSYSSRSF